MYLPDKKVLIIGGVILILFFIWWMSSKKKEGFQTEFDDADQESAIIFPKEQCAKMQGLRATLKYEAERSRNGANTNGKAYEDALKAMELTMNMSGCDMNDVPNTIEEAVTAAVSTVPE
jgi:hypothetical protein